MDYATDAAKKAAWRKFILLYGISLLIIIPAVYFLFNTPASIFKKSIQQYKTAAVEEADLLSKTDAITTNIYKIIEADNGYKAAINVPEKEKFKEELGQYTNEVTNALQDLENDSASRKSSTSKRNANNYLFMFRNFIEYMNASSNDFAALESRKDLPSQFRRVLDSMRSYQVQRESLRAQLAAALIKNPTQTASVQNTDAASRAANEKLIDDLQNKLKQIQSDLTSCNQKNSTLSQSASQTQTQTTNLTQQQMSSLLVDAGKRIYGLALQGKSFKGGTIEQRGYFACARQVFEEAKSHAPSSDIDEYLKNIDSQIKKLSY